MRPVDAVLSSCTFMAADSASPLDVAGIVSVFLPLAPEHRLPAAIDAAHAALLWLRDVTACSKDGNNGDLVDLAVGRLRDEADFSRVFLIGDSSGGNLVHLVAASAAKAGTALHPVRIAGGVLLNPGFAKEEKSRSELDNPPSLFLTEEMVDKLLALGLPVGVNKDSQYTSPVVAAQAVACLKMPPMLLMVAEKDLLHDPQVEYGEAMVRIGKTVETVVSKGSVAHIFYLNFFAVDEMASITTSKADPTKTVIIEEVTGWLRLYSDGTVERLTPPGAEPFNAIIQPYTEPRNGVTVHDITTTKGVDVRLYLHEPAASTPQQRRPVLLHLHGGGFCLSPLYHNFYAPLDSKLDVAGIVSVFLPLAPEHCLPAAINAGHAALLWLRDVACGNSNAHVDPAVGRLRDETDFSRVFLIGDSAGGNLVQLIAASSAKAGTTALHPLRIAGGVLLHPGFAKEEKTRSELENPPSLFLTEEMVDKLLTLGLPVGINKDSQYTSPVLAAEAVAYLKMPPMLLMVAEKDLLHDRQVEYGEAMVRVGKTVETLVSRGSVVHIFYLNFFAVESDPLTAERTRELIDAIKTFINRH
uniref:Alpha/beta hydrolase fold-3 domain-containing protein n=1 Tax=Leersia perrieri TaxID=77586 RepID=A0A0D9XWP6_9ORYZ